jgi:hypothetical protein
MMSTSADDGSNGGMKKMNTGREQQHDDGGTGSIDGSGFSRGDKILVEVISFGPLVCFLSHRLKMMAFKHIFLCSTREKEAFLTRYTLFSLFIVYNVNYLYMCLLYRAPAFKSLEPVTIPLT